MKEKVPIPLHMRGYQPEKEETYQEEQKRLRQEEKQQKEDEETLKIIKRGIRDVNNGTQSSTNSLREDF